MGMRDLTVLVLAWCLLAPVAGADVRAVIADAGVVALADGSYVVRVRSTAPQAFDVVASEGPGAFTVRLYNASRGDMPPLDPAPFGAVRLWEDGFDVLLRLDLAAGWTRVRARQGDGAGVVEVQIAP